MLSLLFLTLTEPKTAEKAIESRDERLENALRRLAEGDEQALAEIYEETRASVFGFALSISKNRQDAEDATHDTYVALYSHAASYKPMGKPLAWILTIARNFALKNLKKSSRVSTVEEDWERCEDEGENEGEQIQKKLVILEAMKSLSDEERQIVTLHAVSGLKHRQIAELLDIPLSTVLSKYNRSIKKIRKELTKGDVE